MGGHSTAAERTEPLLEAASGRGGYVRRPYLGRDHPVSRPAAGSVPRADGPAVLPQPTEPVNSPGSSGILRSPRHLPRQRTAIRNRGQTSATARTQSSPCTSLQAKV